MISRLHVWQPSDLQTGVTPAVLAAALSRLLQSHRYARDARCDPWQFAVELETFLALGATPNDLRWLVIKGHVEHAREVTAPRDTIRCFRPRDNLAFGQRTAFVLSDAGALLAEAILGLLDGSNNQAESVSRPRWDAAYRALFFDGRIVKRYRVPSPNQEALLKAFEEEGWPRRIDDPLPPRGEVAPKSRLNNTIKCLNRRQECRLVCFTGDGTGEGVCWEPVVDGVLTVPLEKGRNKLRLAA